MGECEYTKSYMLADAMCWGKQKEREREMNRCKKGLDDYYAAGALCPLMNPEQMRSSSFMVKGDVPGDHMQTRNNNRRNRSLEFRHPANK